MSFTFAISRTNTVLLAALACALSANVCAAGGSMEECADYAEKAFFTVDDMKRIKCGEVDRSGGPGRFTVNYDEHFDWCRRYSTPQARASETQARNDAKNACSAKPESKAQKAKNDMCKRYSDNALRVSSDMKELKCEEIGSMWDTRYSLASNHHRDWCLNESTPQTLQFERETRTAAANACKARKAKEVSCQEYATNAVQMSNSYQISRCTTEHHPTGRFDYRFQQHYNWCMYTANHLDGEPDREDAARTAELYACKQRNAEKAKKSTPSNKLKTASVQQSADVDESSEDAPLQVSHTVDPTVEDGSVLIVDTEKPAPKQRTQVIVIGNRYTEVPAFDEPQDEGSRLGTVVKAGAAAVVVGTAAVVTGAVAAKVLDYAHDYKGGINKTMSGAAEALKEKLKDRLYGGGINKSASGAVEAMKEKIKDGFQGGGINKSMSGAAAALKEKAKDKFSGGGITKAMSGAKEALKYKLKERVAGGGLVSKAASGFKEKVKSRLTGGGGGLMKGMAKASGGVLRGLLRR